MELTDHSDGLQRTNPAGFNELSCSATLRTTSYFQLQYWEGSINTKWNLFVAFSLWNFDFLRFNKQHFTVIGSCFVRLCSQLLTQIYSYIYFKVFWAPLAATSQRQILFFYSTTFLWPPKRNSFRYFSHHQCAVKKYCFSCRHHCNLLVRNYCFSCHCPGGKCWNVLVKTSMKTGKAAVYW